MSVHPIETPPEPGLQTDRDTAESGKVLSVHFQAVAKEARIPAIAYAVISRGQLIVSGGVASGTADMGAKPGADTQSRICSLTKSFTSAALLMLRDRGELDLERPVASYVPETSSWAPPAADSAPLSVSMLMSMMGGLPEDDRWGDRCLDWPTDRTKELIGRGITFARPPGLCFEYSNLGWVILGQLIRAVSGRRAQDFIRDEILVPLGLNETSWTPGRQCLRGYRLRRGVTEPEDEPLGDGEFAPMGGLWSTASDICRWIGFFLDSYPSRDELATGPLSRSSRRAMQQLRSIIPPSSPFGQLGITRGYGWGLFVEYDEQLGYAVGHAGGLPGYGAHMRWLPERNIGIAALGNLTYAPLDTATRQALILLADRGLLPSPHRAIETGELARVGDGFAALLNEWDDVAAAQVFSDNVFLDNPPSEVTDDLTAIRRAIGSVESISLDPDSATRGTLTLAGATGQVRIWLMLTPEKHPRIQRYMVLDE